MKYSSDTSMQRLFEGFRKSIKEQVGSEEEYSRHGIEVFYYKDIMFGIKHNHQSMKSELFHINPDTGIPQFVKDKPSSGFPLPDKEAFFSDIDMMMQNGAFQT